MEADVGRRKTMSGDDLSRVIARPDSAVAADVRIRIQPAQPAEALCPGWPSNIRPNGLGGCAISIRNMPLYPNLIINDIMA
jgi:hypothetical protein